MALIELGAFGVALTVAMVAIAAWAAAAELELRVESIVFEGVVVDVEMLRPIVLVGWQPLIGAVGASVEVPNE